MFITNSDASFSEKNCLAFFYNSETKASIITIVVQVCDCLFYRLLLLIFAMSSSLMKLLALLIKVKGLHAAQSASSSLEAFFGRRESLEGGAASFRED